jgi:hypothetical protein
MDTDEEAEDLPEVKRPPPTPTTPPLSLSRVNIES